MRFFLLLAVSFAFASVSLASYARPEWFSKGRTLRIAARALAVPVEER